jgi:pyridinium-3,5-biscarboxylic acid mononucleotide sulfurtransferase
MATTVQTPLGNSEQPPPVETAAPALDAATEAKLHALESHLEELSSLMVAYSGGVDSAFLAATAHRVLGNRMLAVLADSPSLARRDMEQAREFARTIAMPLRVIATEELDRPEYQLNDANRCFHCKDELFTAMQALGSKLGFTSIAYGMNSDDTRDFRPGQRAAREHAVLAP